MAKKKNKGSEKGSAGSSEPKRIELISPAENDQAHVGRIGLGLVMSFPLGWGPLSDAFAGRGSYEESMGKFLIVVGACVLGTTIIGKILDSAPNPGEENLDPSAEPSTANSTGLDAESRSKLTNQ